MMNNHLMEEISKLQKEALLIQGIPQKLNESLANCKVANEDVFSTLQSFAADEKSPTAKLLSSTSEIFKYLISTFEANVSLAMNGFKSTCRSSPIEENKTAQNVRDERGNSQSSDTYKDGALGQQIALWKAEVSGQNKLIKERYESLEQESDFNNHLLEASKERIQCIEKESQLLIEEREKLLLATSDSSKRLASLTQQNEKILQDLVCEIRRRKDLEEKIRQFSITYASRQNSLMSFHTEFKSKIDYLKAQNQAVLSSTSSRSSFGC